MDRIKKFFLFSCDLVINQLKVAAQKLSEEENIFSGLLSKELKVYLDNGFPADFLNNLCEELNGKVNAKSRVMFY